MLQNAYFLAKIGADTAENEQHFAEILPIGRRVATCRRRGYHRAGWDSKHGFYCTGCWQRWDEAWDPTPPKAASDPKIANFLQNIANFWRARSRLYQNEILKKKNICV